MTGPTDKVQSLNEPAVQDEPPMPTMSINEPEGSMIGTPALAQGQRPGDHPAEQPVDAPELLDIDPDFVTATGENFILTCTGEGFDETCKIVLDDDEMPTTCDSSTSARAVVGSAKPPGVYLVSVRNAAGDSEPIEIEFLEPERAAVAKARPKKPAKASKKKRR